MRALLGPTILMYVLAQELPKYSSLGTFGVLLVISYLFWLLFYFFYHLSIVWVY